jgi:hypothetical protein
MDRLALTPRAYQLDWAAVGPGSIMGGSNTAQWHSNVPRLPARRRRLFSGIMPLPLSFALSGHAANGLIRRKRCGLSEIDVAG